MANTTLFSTVPSPVGELLLVADRLGLRGIYLESQRAGVRPDPTWREDAAALAGAREELDAYFRGDLRTFSVPLNPEGTSFQRRVWQRLQAIPFGSTTTYGAIARDLGKPTASRAVGAANGQNPISIIVPCHRVVGQNGSLTGYAGGLAVKQALLEHEAAVGSRRR